MIIPYFENIEERILEQINDAQHSIHIAVAWFTSERIMNALLTRKLNIPTINIEIVVDDNDVNQQYFFPKAVELERNRIKILKKSVRKFLHVKFMTIDAKRVMTGSYNFTEKAKGNKENFVLVDNAVFAQFYQRVFKSLTDQLYIDENITLLLKYPEFTRQLISAYYPFSKLDVKKYRSRITPGYCYTVDVGDYDQIYYKAGYLFNPVCRKQHHEFPIPITKDVLNGWNQGRLLHIMGDWYRQNPDREDDLANYIDEGLNNIETYYRAKLRCKLPLFSAHFGLGFSNFIRVRNRNKSDVLQWWNKAECLVWPRTVVILLPFFCHQPDFL